MIEVITSFNQHYYDLIGQDSLKSFLNFWDPEIGITVYVEEFALPEHPRVKQIDFSQLDPAYFELQQQGGYNVSVRKFSKKAYSVIHALTHSTADWIVWLDSDVVTVKEFPKSALVSLLDPTALSMYMGVTYTTNKAGEAGHWLVPETGLFAVNTRHEKFEVFRDEYIRRYKERDHNDLRRFYDNDVFGAALGKANAKVVDLCTGFEKPYKTPLPHTVLGQYLIHYKAKHSKAEYQAGAEDQ